MPKCCGKHSQQQLKNGSTGENRYRRLHKLPNDRKDNTMKRTDIKADILSLLHPVRPTPIQAIGNTFGLLATKRVVTLADARVELISTLWEMTQAGLIDFIEGQGYIKKK